MRAAALQDSALLMPLDLTGRIALFPFIGGLRPPNPPTWRFAPKRAPRATQKGGEGPIYCNLGDFHFFQLVKISMQPDILTYIGSLIQYFLIFFMGREKNWKKNLGQEILKNDPKNTI